MKKLEERKYSDEEIKADMDTGRYIEALAKMTYMEYFAHEHENY